MIRYIKGKLQNLLKIFKHKTAGDKDKIGFDLSKIIQVIVINLETGTTLVNALETAAGEYFYIRDVSILDTINKKAVLFNNKDFYRFVRLINDYHRNGSPSTISALQTMYGDLCMQEMSKIKMKAEQATVKLTLLLMLSLISIVLVVLTPVMLMINSTI